MKLFSLDIHLLNFDKKVFSEFVRKKDCEETLLLKLANFEEMILDKIQSDKELIHRVDEIEQSLCSESAAVAVKKDENSEKVIQRIDELEKYVKTTSNSFNIRLHNMGLGSSDRENIDLLIFPRTFHLSGFEKHSAIKHNVILRPGLEINKF